MGRYHIHLEEMKESKTEYFHFCDLDITPYVAIQSELDDILEDFGGMVSTVIAAGDWIDTILECLRRLNVDLGAFANEGLLTTEISEALAE